VEHLSKAVRCHHCRKAFTTRPAGDTALHAADARPATAGAVLDVGGVTSAGRVRQDNEDSFLVQRLAWGGVRQQHEVALLVVADGMGGHAGGAEASRLVTQTVGATLAPVLHGAVGAGPPAQVSVLADAVESAIHRANRVAYQRSRSNAACKGMGAAAAVVLLWDALACVAHVGDCRVYHLRGHRLHRLTRDHTLVARMLELGQLTVPEAAGHPEANQLIQAVGARSRVEPSSCRVRMRPGDWLVVASDGLAAHVADDALQEALRRPSRSARHLAGYLVDLANRRGGSDNCTVVAAQYVGVAPPTNGDGRAPAQAT
jgi:protein phosphatase